jgi:AraC family transcriptional regulator, activator of mtrCDE
MSNRPDEDLLSSVLSAYQLRAGIYDTPRLCGEFQFGTAGDRRASFHLLGEGSCWLHTKVERQPLRLHAGDLIVMPHDDWHMLSANERLAGSHPRMTTEGEGPYTTFLCGFFQFLSGYRNPVVASLPPIIIVRKDEGGATLHTLSHLLLSELGEGRPGTLALLNKLSDALFVLVLRHHIAVTPQPAGLVAGLADARVRKALDAIHRAPGEEWTVEKLAEQALMSRSAFAQRFAQLLGSGPMEYLTRWRMTHAELLLRDPHVSVAAAAEATGYTDESAFRKAFKRVHGFAPGMLRRWFRS